MNKPNYEVVEVVVLPDCDVCGGRGVKTKAQYDAATDMGPWAYMCEGHFKQHGVGLGLGRGQRLELVGDRDPR